MGSRNWDLHDRTESMIRRRGNRRVASFDDAD